MNTLKNLFPLSLACLLLACAGQPIPSGPIDAAPAMPTEPLKHAQDIASEVSTVPTPPKPQPQSQPSPQLTPAKSTEQSWTMKSGKLRGADQPSAKLISKIKDAKTGQTITSMCFKFADFAIEEVRATGEIGAAEVNLRRANTPGQSLCAADFKGSVKNLPAIEGFFAGATPDFVIVEGADPAETIPDFQLISLKTMKQTFKGRHEPGQDFTITKRGPKTSLIYHAPMTVKCELAVEGIECWKQVLKLNGVRGGSPLPDCKQAESVLVTMRAQINDIESPKIEFLGGPAICRPEK